MGKWGLGGPQLQGQSPRDPLALCTGCLPLEGRWVGDAMPRRQWHDLNQVITAPAGQEMRPPSGTPSQGLYKQGPTQNSGRPTQREPLPKVRARERRHPDPRAAGVYGSGLPPRQGTSRRPGPPGPFQGSPRSLHLRTARPTRARLRGLCQRLQAASRCSPKQRDPIVSL